MQSWTQHADITKNLIMKLEFERYTKLRNQISLKKKASGKAKFLETHKKGKEAQLYVTQCTRRRAFSIEAWKAAVYRAAAAASRHAIATARCCHRRVRLAR